MVFLPTTTGVFIGFTVLMQIFAVQEVSGTVCQTSLCKETATRILESLNTKVNPCDDFYEYACRGWIEKNPIQDGQSSGALQDIRKDVWKRLQKILSEPNKRTDGRSIKVARAMYKTCVDLEALENIGLQPVYDVFRKLGLPLKPPTDGEAEKLNIPRIVGLLNRFYGKDIFVTMAIKQDWRDGTKNRLMIVQPEMSIHNLVRNLLDPVGNEEELKLQRLYIRKMWHLAGAKREFDAYTDEIMSFITDLAKIMVKPQSRILSSHMIKDQKIYDLQRNVDCSANKWNWMVYLNASFANSNVVLDFRKDVAGVADNSYMEAFPKLFNMRSLGTLVRYIWFEIWSFFTSETTEFFRKFGVFLSAKRGPLPQISRPEACIMFVNKYFDLTITAAYVKRHFNVQEKRKVIEMWNDVSSAFDDMLTENSWLDDRTKAEAHRKLHFMKIFVGFPDWISDSRKLEEHYGEIEVFDGRLFDTYTNLDSVARMAELNSWRQAPDKDKWRTSGTTVNAIYDRLANSATFTAGILHKPFYGNGVAAIDYGGVGAVMGHELTHGFDGTGYQFDKNGNVRNWWTRFDLRRFTQKAMCILKQYSSYVVAQLGINVDGQLTMDENIADNGGLTEAFRAYKKLKARIQPQPGLPGLEQYTDEQLFFLGFAQAFCSSYTNAALQHIVKTDPHAPGRYRVIGTLQNSEVFARVWNCPRNSAMIPKQRCIVW